MTRVPGGGLLEAARTLAHDWRELWEYRVFYTTTQSVRADMSTKRKFALALVFAIIAAVGTGWGWVYTEFIKTQQVMSGTYRKGGFTGVIGHLGDAPVSIPKEFAKFVEYDGDPGFMEKRKGPIPKRTYELGICSFGFEFRYPDMTPVNKQTWKEKREENIHTTLWMSVGVLSNSTYQDRSPARMAGTLAKAWLKNAYYRYEEQPEKIHGLTVFVPVNTDVSRRHHDPQDINIYIHRLNDGGVDAYIKCSNIHHEAITM
jgi:hypothetical protein